MVRGARILLTVLLLAATAVAGNGARAEIQVSAWETIEADPRFVIDMPAPVERETEIDGDGVVSTDFAHDADIGTYFLVSVIDYPEIEDAADVPDLLIGMEQATIESLDDGVRASAAVAKIGRWPGREFSALFDRGRLMLQGRLYFTHGSRLYLITVVSRPRDANDPAIRRYFDSFRLIGN